MIDVHSHPFPLFSSSLPPLIPLFVEVIIEKQVGLGTFGKVFQCWDQRYDESVAMKVVRNIKKYVDSAKIEAEILDRIYRKQKAASFDGCLQLFGHFEFNGKQPTTVKR